MKKVAVFSGTRAEYGLLFWLMKDIQSDPELSLQVIVSGMHLSPEFGLTYRQIEDDGFIINEKVEMLLSSDTATGVAKSIGLGIIGFSDALSRMKPDLIILLGDRTEALALAQTAMILRIPICHLHGGEITEGAYDDAMRHAITKLSYLHFTATSLYRQRVIQLGEQPERVFNVGAIGLDYLKRGSFIDKTDFLHSLGLGDSRPYFLVTYHPVTLADEPPKESFNQLLSSLDMFPEYNVILTYPNSDDGGRQIIPLLESYARVNADRVVAIPSLGQKRYLTAVKYAAAVIGNSSSGIIEVPSFQVPTVNIGARQKGRIAAASVLHCNSDISAITHAINDAIRLKPQMQITPIANPYGSGGACKQILNLIKSSDFQSIKSFYDIE